jgi:hypothetical protein
MLSLQTSLFIDKINYKFLIFHMHTNKRKKRIRIIWTIITILGVISMVAFSLAPLIRSY